MIGEWIRFGLCAAFLLAGLFIMVVSIIGLYRFDFALQRIHADKNVTYYRAALIKAALCLDTGHGPG